MKRRGKITHPSIHPFFLLSVCLSVYLSIYLSYSAARTEQGTRDVVQKVRVMAGIYVFLETILGGLCVARNLHAAKPGPCGMDVVAIVIQR